METRKRVLSVEYLDTLNGMNNLAFTQERQGRDTKALKLMEECVQLQTWVLDIDHPNTISSFAALIRWQTKKLDISALALGNEK